MMSDEERKDATPAETDEEDRPTSDPEAEPMAAPPDPEAQPEPPGEAVHPDGAEAVIRTVNLRKEYSGVTALKGIDLVVEEGDLFGFIGPNGAGKTTTIKILTTLLEPTSGDAFVGGFSVWDRKDEIRGLIGYMPDSFGVYRDMKVTEYLHFFAAAYGVPSSERDGLVKGLLELTDLAYKKDALIDTLSRGMQQRLGLARTLVHDPQVVILDEPASGLDPRARIEIREILMELQGMGKTILLSSHILSELAEICNKVAIIERGEMVAQGTLDEIMAMVEDRSLVMLGVDKPEQAMTLLKGHPAVEGVEYFEDQRLVRVDLLGDQPDVSWLPEMMIQHNLRVDYLNREQLTLEEVFMKLTKGLVQ
jgi:ABC-2 type transport system ATP-binding protein